MRFILFFCNKGAFLQTLRKHGKSEIKLDVNADFMKKFSLDKQSYTFQSHSQLDVNILSSHNQFLMYA